MHFSLTRVWERKEVSLFHPSWRRTKRVTWFEYECVFWKSIPKSHFYLFILITRNRNWSSIDSHYFLMLKSLSFSILAIVNTIIAKLDLLLLFLLLMLPAGPFDWPEWVHHTPVTCDSGNGTDWSRTSSVTHTAVLFSLYLSILESDDAESMKRHQEVGIGMRLPLPDFQQLM